MPFVSGNLDNLLNQRAWIAYTYAMDAGSTTNNDEVFDMTSLNMQGRLIDEKYFTLSTTGFIFQIRGLYSIRFETNAVPASQNWFTFDGSTVQVMERGNRMTNSPVFLFEVTKNYASQLLQMTSKNDGQFLKSVVIEYLGAK